MNVKAALKHVLERWGQTLVNLFLVVWLGHYVVHRGGPALRAAWVEGDFDFVRISFFLHNVLMLSVILIRRRHEALDRNVLHQAVALVAFFSGMTFVETASSGPVLLRISQGVTLAAIALGVVSLLNLGRSFGILISIRKVKTNGLYGVIRHPMYFSDILWRVGCILNSPCALNFAIFVVSSGCYVYRALLEERFLSQWPEYRQYMGKVRYRFLPGIF